LGTFCKLFRNFFRHFFRNDVSPYAQNASSGFALRIYLFFTTSGIMGVAQRGPDEAAERLPAEQGGVESQLLSSWCSLNFPEKIPINFSGKRKNSGKKNTKNNSGNSGKNPGRIFPVQGPARTRKSLISTPSCRRYSLPGRPQTPPPNPGPIRARIGNPGDRSHGEVAKNDDLQYTFFEIPIKKRFRSIGAFWCRLRNPNRAFWMAFLR